MSVAKQLRLCVCALLLTVCVSRLGAQSADNSVVLDLYAFSQEDNGGNPIQNEDLLYYGARVAARIKVSKVLVLRSTATVSQLESGGRVTVPATITNATTTSASQRASGSAGSKSHFTPITTSLGFDITPKDTKWTISPGLFFSYQDNYISRGVDFAVSSEWFGGNTIPSLSYGLRWDTLSALSVSAGGAFGSEEEEEEDEDGGGGGGSKTTFTRFTHNFQIGVTQIVAKWCRISASFQYTRQDGKLSAPNAIVTIFNGRTPVLFAQENLPNYRNRFQFNVRAKFSPVTGYALGVDHSAYLDDWGIENFAIEPNAEGQFAVPFARWRVWYRLSTQGSTAYMRVRPQNEFRFQTDDADLASFSTHSGGALFFFDVAHWGTLHWIVRVSVYANYRTDDIFGYGAMLGTEFNW
jgi:hypothetical protein